MAYSILEIIEAGGAHDTSWTTPSFDSVELLRRVGDDGSGFESFEVKGFSVTRNSSKLMSAPNVAGLLVVAGNVGLLEGDFAGRVAGCQ